MARGIRKASWNNNNASRVHPILHYLEGHDAFSALDPATVHDVLVCWRRLRWNVPEHVPGALPQWS